MLDGQRYEFLGDAFPAVALASPSEPNDPHFLLPIGMQKRPGVSTCSIFQSNLHIVVRSSLSCPPGGIRCNPGIVARSSLSCSPASIRHTLFLRSSSMPLPGKTVPANGRALQRGLLFLFVHCFSENCCVEGGEIGEEVCSVGKVSEETHL